ncbi:hypothetical protein OROHE_013515 [Orobanche hederae]
MEKKTASFPLSRQWKLKTSFECGVVSLLTACSYEKFCKEFQNFTAAEQERLHGLFLQVISSAHEDVQEAFDSFLLEYQVGEILDNVDALVEEYELDPLKSKKSNIGETARSLSEAKKNELKNLMGLVEKTEEQNREMKARLEQELLQKEKQDSSGAANLADEVEGPQYRITRLATDTELAD